METSLVVHHGIHVRKLHFQALNHTLTFTLLLHINTQRIRK